MLPGYFRHGSILLRLRPSVGILVTKPPERARAAFQTYYEFGFVPTHAGQGVKNLLTLCRSEAELGDDLDRVADAAWHGFSCHEISPKLMAQDIDRSS